ncbi:hypothetical protein INR49_008903, partial [Caranx melampygus]
KQLEKQCPKQAPCYSRLSDRPSAKHPPDNRQLKWRFLLKTTATPHLHFEYKGAHQAFRDRWKGTDDSMCRHSMSFHLHHTLRSEFFASYLYLLEKTPLVRRATQGPTLRKPLISCSVKRWMGTLVSLDTVFTPPLKTPLRDHMT